jgi:hypothetical protein
MKHDIKRLEDKIKRLHHSISTLSISIQPPDPGDPNWMWHIIHNPGWTSIAEFALVEASIDSLHNQIETATEQYKRVLEAATQVGKDAGVREHLNVKSS